MGFRGCYQKTWYLLLPVHIQGIQNYKGSLPFQMKHISVPENLFYNTLFFGSISGITARE